MTRESGATASAADIKRYERNYRGEVDGGALYRMLSEIETSPEMSEVFGHLARSEDRHRALWEEKLKEAGARVPRARPSVRVKVLAWLARRFGTRTVLPTIMRLELADTTMYDQQPEAVEAGLPEDERSHARIFREMAVRRAPPGMAGREIARLEGRHVTGAGNALRAAVLGFNDGIVSTLLLITGVAGAGPGRDVVLLTGISGLLAGAASMALGEWISVRSSAEAFERQRAIERDELEVAPDEEQEELTLIYRAKGLSPEAAAETARRIMSDPKTALDTLAREELGMSADDVGSPWVAAVTSFLLFALGAALPVIPWFVASGAAGIGASVTIAGIGLFVAGAATAVLTGRGLVFSGGRMLVIGLVAAAVTFGIGRVVGVSTGL